MNLVVGYDSSDGDEEPQQQPQHRPQHLEVGKPPGEGKALLSSTSTGTAPAQASTKPLQQSAKPASSKGKKRKDVKTGTTKKNKKKKKSKSVNALVLSPEIQAALARGDTLGDSDSDDQDAHKKPPKFVRRPAGSDPNDLLSLLPQPSTATSADDILLKNKKRRQDASQAKSQAALLAPPSGRAAANGGGGSVGGSAAADRGMAAPAASETRTGEGEGSGSREAQAVPSQASDSDDDGDHLLSGMDAKSAATAAAAGAAAAGARPGEGAAGGPLFTLPSRSRPPAGAAASGFLLPGEGMEGPDTVVPEGVDAAQQEVGQEGQAESVGHQWGAAGYGYEAGIAPPAWQTGTGYGGAVGAAVVGTESGTTAPQQHAAHGAASFQVQQHQPAPYYPPAAAQASAVFGDPTPQTAGGHEAGFGGGGGKATRRKGRDMERALARGDLGALGSETPVMDLHQGSNDYNPLRTKPVTAAMKQDQKHIEGSVYDPSTGQTVKTLEPTSTQKRKHQINQLAVQAASMERDLMERSGASRLTKAQTHAKYGW